MGNHSLRSGTELSPQEEAHRYSDLQDVSAALRRLGLLGDAQNVRLVPLTAGVSSDVWRVQIGDRLICVKRPLARLRGPKEWRAPVERGLYEARWLEFVGRLIPGRVPVLHGYDHEGRILAMEYLAEDAHFRWKELLRDGVVDTDVAALVAEALAKTHAASARSESLQADFDAHHILYGTRIDPYFEATAASHPKVAHKITNLSASLRAARVAVMHGDVSPKNILVGQRGPIFLDAECACVGDPAFDVAFFLTHLCLKCIWQPRFIAGYLKCYEAFATAYCRGVNWESSEAIHARASRLLALFLLARIDGKVPVEYITTERQRDTVREFALQHLCEPFNDLFQMVEHWYKHVTGPAA